MLTVLEARQVGDHWCVRYNTTPAGIYVPYRSPIDAMIAYCADFISHTGSPKTVGDRIGIPRESVSKSRNGITAKFNDAWILWAHEYTNAPITSLRIITNTRSHAP